MGEAAQDRDGEEKLLFSVPANFAADVTSERRRSSPITGKVGMAWEPARCGRLQARTHPGRITEDVAA